MTQKKLSLQEMQRHTTYKSAIETQMTRLAAIQDYTGENYQSSLNIILKAITELDQQFIKDSNSKLNGHILFSRHGKCTPWEQKKFGLNPNSALSEEAVQNMSSTNTYTAGLLLNQEHTSLYAVSPLVRTKQTASLLIPIHHQNALLSIEPALAENSIAPSGINLKNRHDMKETYHHLSFWEAPLQVILFKLSLCFYGNEDVFAQIETKSNIADRTLNELVEKVTNNDSDGYQITPLHEEAKIQKIQTMLGSYLSMNDAQKGDLWLFGHGKNIKAYFTSTFGISTNLEYCETRRVYGLLQDNKSSLFSPPYTFEIDQDTGRIRGKYTENTFAVVNNPIRSDETTPLLSNTRESHSTSSSML